MIMWVGCRHPTLLQGLWQVLRSVFTPVSRGLALHLGRNSVRVGSYRSSDRVTEARVADFRQALPVGSTLAGDYRITGVLGQGGFGITYKAEDLRLHAPVAIKEYFPAELALREHGSTVVPRSVREQGVLEWGRAKFLEEARTLARFRHPSIVRVARLFEANNTAYMVLDFELGPSLAEWRPALGREPTQFEADRIVMRLLDAVGAVHAAGILHRDIKPANVIMRDGTDPVLIDFGAARQALSAQSRTVHAIVTPGYSPKEQYAVDLDRQGAWSDIYALGATLYFLVTGRAPPDALSRDLGEEMKTAASTTGNWRQGFLAAIDQAMSVRAEERPQSVAEWRDMLLAAPSGPQRMGAAAATRSATETQRPLPAASARPDHTSSPRRLSFDEISQPSSATRSAEPGARRIVASAVVAGIVALGGLGYWIGVAAPARDAASWQRAIAENTPAAYERYIAEQPSGHYVAEARSRRIDIERRTVSASGVALAASEPPTATPPVAPIPAEETPTPLPVTSAPPTIPVQPPPDTPAKSIAVASRAPETPTAPSLPIQVEPEPRTQPAVASPAAVFEARTALPPALSDQESARLAAAVPAGRSRLWAGLFGTDRVSGFTDQAGDFVAELERLSHAKLSVSLLTGDALPPADELPRRLTSERDLFAWQAPARAAGRQPELGLLSGSVPFGLEPSDHVRWLRADGARYLELAHIDDGNPMRVIPCGIAGGVGAWFKKEVRSPSDFRSLKVRAPHLLARALARLDAQVVSLPSNNQVGPAFADNRLDAHFGVTPLTGIFLAQPRVAAVYHYPGVHQPAYLFTLVLAPGTWAAMPAPQQRLIDEACRRNLDRWAQAFPSSQNEVLDRVRTQRIVVRPFTGPVREALQKAVDATLADEASKSPRFREVLDSYNRFRR